MFKSNFLIVFAVLVVLIGGLIHVLLVVGVIMLIVHFLRGRP
jgi:hypothetical protein